MSRQYTKVETLSEEVFRRKRQGKSAGDQWLIDLIIDCQQRSKQTYGFRRVRRWTYPSQRPRVTIQHIPSLF